MYSPFADHFGTNYVPTDEEINQIQQDLVSHTEQRDQLDGCIRELSEKREKLQAFIDAQKALISSPRRLHTDLLENIFLACLPAGGISVIRRNSVMSAQEAPLLFCWVCGGWRKAAMSMPRLWASLHIPVDFILARDTRASAVDNWLKRAAACPMSLSVWDNRGRWEWGETLHSEDDMLALAKSLRTHSPGWHEVVFTDPSPHMAQTLREIDEAPNLASFTLHGSAFLATQLRLLNSPSLRTLNLFSHDDLNVVLAIPLVAWQQLTQLNLQSSSSPSGSLSLANMIILVGKCSQLVSFCATLETDDEVPMDLGSMPVSAALPCLDVFVINPLCVLPSWYLTIIADFLSMPHLRHLQVTLASSSAGPEPFSLASIGAKLPLLEYLTVQLDTLGSQSLPEILRSFPSLARLVVEPSANRSSDQSCDTTQLMQNLMDRTICPRLRELDVRSSSALRKSTLEAFLCRKIRK